MNFAVNIISIPYTQFLFSTLQCFNKQQEYIFLSNQLNTRLQCSPTGINFRTNILGQIQNLSHLILHNQGHSEIFDENVFQKLDLSVGQNLGQLKQADRDWT